MKKDQPKLTFMRMLPWVIFSLAVAIISNETILPDRGMSVGFGIIATAITAKLVIGEARRSIYIPYVFFVFAMHLIFVFVGPDDDQYTGGILFPLGILDVIVFYLLFHWVKRIFPDQTAD